eukprot:363802-Chlamydomonas_euryale.AAC.7
MARASEMLKAQLKSRDAGGEPSQVEVLQAELATVSEALTAAHAERSAIASALKAAEAAAADASRGRDELAKQVALLREAQAAQAEAAAAQAAAAASVKARGGGGDGGVAMQALQEERDALFVRVGELMAELAGAYAAIQTAREDANAARAAASAAAADADAARAEASAAREAAAEAAAEAIAGGSARALPPRAVDRSASTTPQGLRSVSVGQTPRSIHSRSTSATPRDSIGGTAVGAGGGAGIRGGGGGEGEYIAELQEQLQQAREQIADLQDHLEEMFGNCELPNGVAGGDGVPTEADACNEAPRRASSHPRASYSGMIAGSEATPAVVDVIQEVAARLKELSMVRNAEARMLGGAHCEHAHRAAKMVQVCAQSPYSPLLHLLGAAAQPNGIPRLQLSGLQAGSLAPQSVRSQASGAFTPLLPAGASSACSARATGYNGEALAALQPRRSSEVPPLSFREGGGFVPDSARSVHDAAAADVHGNFAFGTDSTAGSSPQTPGIVPGWAADPAGRYPPGDPDAAASSIASGGGTRAGEALLLCAGALSPRHLVTSNGAVVTDMSNTGVLISPGEAYDSLSQVLHIRQKSATPRSRGSSARPSPRVTIDVEEPSAAAARVHARTLGSPGRSGGSGGGGSPPRVHAPLPPRPRSAAPALHGMQRRGGSPERFAARSVTATPQKGFMMDPSGRLLAGRHGEGLRSSYAPRLGSPDRTPGLWAHTGRVLVLNGMEPGQGPPQIPPGPLAAVSASVSPSYSLGLTAPIVDVRFQAPGPHGSALRLSHGPEPEACSKFELAEQLRALREDSGRIAAQAAHALAVASRTENANQELAAEVEHARHQWAAESNYNRQLQEELHNLHQLLATTAANETRRSSSGVHAGWAGSAKRTSLAQTEAVPEDDLEGECSN